MKLLLTALLLCLALTLNTGSATDPHDHPSGVDDPNDHHENGPDRCEGLEFDAITPDEKGNTFFFRGQYMWMGFEGPAHHANESFEELDDIHGIGHVDAAFRMHDEKNLDDHDHIYFFLDSKVFSYYNHTLEDGYPKEMQDDFPGVPDHLDAAVECPEGECPANSVLFFKGHDVYIFDIPTKTVKMKTWAHLPVCTSAFRWLEHYYCFHQNNFTRFNPLTGEIAAGNYPKDARKYFMRCPNFGHGHGNNVTKCSDIHVDAISTDDSGKTYAFVGSHYLRMDSNRDGLHHFPIVRQWNMTTNGVDAVFSYDGRMYMIKDDQVYIYKSAGPYQLIAGYPKPLKEELGFEGHVDAAFVCNEEHFVHVIQGENMLKIDLVVTPRVVTETIPLSMTHIDAALCSSKGVTAYKGSQFFEFESPLVFAASKMMPIPHQITSAMMGCKD